MPSSRRRLQQGWEDLGVTVLQGYGATETGTGSCTRLEDHGLGTVGRPPEGVAMRIADDGEIQFKGPTVFRGYWDNPTATAEAFTPDGWYRTGDIGHLDAAGRLILSGRMKDIIVLPNGFNVYPEDIENALRIAGIRDSVVLETRPGRIEAVVLGSATALPGGVEESQPTDAATIRERMDAAVKAANATLGPNQRIAGWRLWPEDDFPGPTRSRSSAPRSGPGSRPTRHSPSPEAPRQFATGNPTPRPSSAVWIPAADGSCAAAGSQSYRTTVDPTWRMSVTVPCGVWTRPGPSRGRPAARGRRGRQRRVGEFVDDDVALVRVLRQDDLVDGSRRRGQQRRLGLADGGLGVGQDEALGRQDADELGARLVDRRRDRLRRTDRLDRERPPALAHRAAARDREDQHAKEAHRADRALDPAGHPGGQSNGRPPIRWTCRWSTVWPPQRPTLETSR